MYMSNWKLYNPKQHDMNCATPQISILLGYDSFIILRLHSGLIFNSWNIQDFFLDITNWHGIISQTNGYFTDTTLNIYSHQLTCWLQYALLWFFRQLFNQEHKYPSYICFAWIQKRLITYIPRITQVLKKKILTAVQGMFIKQQYFMTPLPLLTVYYLAGLSNACSNPKSSWHWIW